MRAGLPLVAAKVKGHDGREVFVSVRGRNIIPETPLAITDSCILVWKGETRDSDSVSLTSSTEIGEF